MASVGKPHKPGGKYRVIYTDARGKRRFTTGSHNRAETLRMAQRLEDDHRQIALGYREPPPSSHRHRDRDVGEVIAEYLAWGKAQGGRGGRPWSQGHAQRRAANLAWWADYLGLVTLGDVTTDILPQVEKALQSLQAQGKTGKTLHTYAEALKAWANWCVTHAYLQESPVRALTGFDTTPQTIRRAMTQAEIEALLAAAPDDRALLYQTAFLSGLRANELRHLQLDHLDLKRSGLHLEAEWTKNRKPGFQPLPHWLCLKIHAFATSGAPADRYAEAYRRGQSKRRPPMEPLLYVPSDPARSLDRDLKAAGIPKETKAGKLDFHACRTAYISLLLELGELTPKEIQELARHKSLELTLHTYGRAREERLAAGVDLVSEAVFEREELDRQPAPDETGPDQKCAISVLRREKAPEREIATRCKLTGCDSKKVAPRVGFEPTTKWLTATRSAS